MSEGYQSVFRADLFKDRVAVVTGGGSGIGRCIAHELSALGAQVVITGRKVEKLEAVKAEILEQNGLCDFRAFDIREEEDVREAIASILKQHGKIDCLVNNAGGQFPAPAEGISKNGFNAVVSTNLMGGFLVAREAFTQHMKEHGGSVVNMLADMWRGMPGMAHSGAARGGMLNLTQTLAVEWAISGVRVNAVAPGWVASSGLDTYEGAAKAMIPMLKEAVPLKRLCTEAEVSAATVFLLSPAASFITGSFIRVDGGAPFSNVLWPIPSHNNSEVFDGFHLSETPEVLSES